MKEIQKKLISDDKSNEECCSICGITQSEYGLTFEINDKNELLCYNCWRIEQ